MNSIQLNGSDDDQFNPQEFLAQEDFQISVQDLAEVEVEVESPIKSPLISPERNPIALDSPNLHLKPNSSNNNPVANALFQVTKHLRNNEIHQNVFGLEDPSNLFEGKKPTNDKIEKLLSQLKEDNDNFELDDQLRTRVFKGRFNKQADHLDHQLNAYLGLSEEQPNVIYNDNKENLAPYPDPLKTKSKDTLKKSNKAYFKLPQRNGNKSNIPVLKPLTNLTNIDLKKPANDNFYSKQAGVKSPMRICNPKKLAPLKPCIKYQKHNHNIFVVDSLTGQINDATQFGTELNASNCEGFPLPEDVNEIVQIPTNEEVSGSKRVQAKMAIIKAFRNKYFSVQKAKRKQRNGKKVGFYSKNEFDEWRSNETPKQVEVFNQFSSQNPTSDETEDEMELSEEKSEPPHKKRKVRWAHQLEW